MLRRRVIPCLDVADGRVVKGTRFVDLVDEGDPPELAERYAREGADELVFLDITAAPQDRGTLLDIVERTARRVFIPLTVGGGVRSVEEMRDVLRAGADKVSLNTAAVADPDLVTACARRFGSQAGSKAGSESAAQAGGGHVDDDADPPVAEHPLVAVLGTTGDTPQDWLVAGQALSALLVRATAAGVRAAPRGEVLDQPGGRRRRGGERGGVGHPQMVLRLGYAEPGPETPRRPVDELLS